MGSASTSPEHASDRLVEALRDNPTFLSGLTAQLPCTLWATDAGLVFTAVTGQGFTLGNARPEGILGADLEAALPPGDPNSATVLEAHRRALAGIPSRYAITEQSGRSWLGYVHPQRQPDGIVIGCLGLSIDVTESKPPDSREATRSWDETLALLNTLVNSAPLGVAFLDRDLRYVRINATLAAMYGPAPEAWIGRTPGEVIPQYAPLLEPVYRQVLAAGEVITDVEMSGHPSGAPRQVRHWLTSCYPVSGPSGELLGVGTVVLDVTEKKKLEQQLQQSQKMEAIGRLASGVAHDFNNLLTVVNGYSDILLSRLSWNDPDREWIREIHKAGERAASLTRQLLAFSRKQVLEPRVLRLNEIVADMEKMLCRLIGEDVRLATSLAPMLPAVKVDPGQMEQVIMNLAVNSRDAMPQGGKLTIETANVELEEAHPANPAEVRLRQYVLLAVSDTGRGMTPEVLEHVFEPFFTTKEAGKGTGLGLATVYGIVKQSNGFLHVYSEPGWGTTFKVYLPAVESPLGSEKPGSRVEPPLGGDETILIVEDDGAVRTLIRVALMSHGYTVLEADRGAEAVRLAETHAATIHLLVTDVVMPEMGGREVADRLTALRPDLKVLYLSGYSDDAVFRHGVLEAQAHFMQKPFAPSGLVAKVRQILGQHEPRRPDPG